MLPQCTADVVAVCEVYRDQHAAAGIASRNLNDLRSEIARVFLPLPIRLRPTQKANDFVEQIGNVMPQALHERCRVRRGTQQSRQPPSQDCNGFRPPTGRHRRQGRGVASNGDDDDVGLSDGSEVVVKVQRPGVEVLVERDLEILIDLARIARERTELDARYDVVGLVEEFGFTLREELDYAREGRNVDQFRELFADDPTLYVPKIYGTTPHRGS